MTLTISSDYASPAEAGSFRVTLAQSTGVLFDNTYPLGAAGTQLPASLVLCPDGLECQSGTIAPGSVAITAGEPVVVNVDLLLGELKLGSQSATVTNTNQAKTVALTFSKACASVVCESGKRCSPAGECVSAGD